MLREAVDIDFLIAYHHMYIKKYIYMYMCIYGCIYIGVPLVTLITVQWAGRFEVSLFKGFQASFGCPVGRACEILGRLWDSLAGLGKPRGAS